MGVHGMGDEDGTYQSGEYDNEVDGYRGYTYVWQDYKASLGRSAYCRRLMNGLAL